MFKKIFAVLLSATLCLAMPISANAAKQQVEKTTTTVTTVTNPDGTKTTTTTTTTTKEVVDGDSTSSSSTTASSSTLTSSTPSLNKLSQKTDLEKAAFKNLKKFDKAAKKAGYTTREYTRKSSSDGKVVTKVYYSGKKKSGNKVYTVEFKHVQTANGEQFYQGSDEFERSIMADLVRNPGNYQ